MRRAVTAALAVLALLAVGARASQTIHLPGIKGSDDRVIVESLAWPWSAIVKVDTDIGSFCTGVLIAPDKVLTAAHCLWRRAPARWLPPGAIHVLVNYRRGNWTDASTVSAVAMGPNPKLPRSGANASTVLDWAVLVLAKPVGTPIPLAGPGEDKVAPGETLLQAGFSQDHSQVLMVDRNCHVVATLDDDHLLLHDCDAVHGDSGSPLMIVDAAGRPRLIGIHNATVRKGGVYYGLGLTIAGLARKLAARVDVVGSR